METVPVMTDPLGKYWEQPNKEAILIDDTHALLSKSSFSKLKNYSSSFPSGVYEGKMWRREVNQNGVTINYICWYGNSDNPDQCSINYREILIAEDE